MSLRKRTDLMPSPLSTEPTPDAGLPAAEELVIESRTGRVRQAGADGEGEWLAQFKLKCERSLFAFTKGILKRDLLSSKLHQQFCASLQAPIPPYRKQRLMPRGHLKSSIVSEALPIHMQIQPDVDKGTNVYWPGVPGSEMNIILCGEKKDLMGSHLRWIESQWESNDLLRGLWPHRAWKSPRRDSKKWNEEEMIIPRARDYADPSIRIIGVDGAIAGAHARVLIKDDLISLAAANSDTVMQTAIDWHIASRALLAPFEDVGLEFIIGTKWAVNDLYAYTLQYDASVDCRSWSIIENGKPIWPEQITMEHVLQLQKEYKSLFYLLYMNSVSNPELTDFSPEDLRTYSMEGGFVSFDEDGRDVRLSDRQTVTPLTKPSSDALRGTKMTPEVRDVIMGNREAYLRFKRG